MANLYNIQDLLIGKIYNSQTLRGEIISADKSDSWFGRYNQGYLVQVRSNTGKYTYRTVAVRADDNSERYVD
jgi:ribosomal 30S subunit maturation factor RimM